MYNIDFMRSGYDTISSIVSSQEKIGSMAIFGLRAGIGIAGSIVNAVMGSTFGSNASRDGEQLLIGLALSEAMAPISKRQYKIVKQHFEAEAKETNQPYQMSFKEASYRLAVILSGGIIPLLERAITGKFGNVTLASAAADYGSLCHLAAEKFFTNPHENIKKSKVVGLAVTAGSALIAAVADRFLDPTGRIILQSAYGQSIGKFVKRQIKGIGKRELEEKQLKLQEKVLTLAAHAMMTVAVDGIVGSLLDSNVVWYNPTTYLSLASVVGIAKLAELVLFSRIDTKKNKKALKAEKEVVLQNLSIETAVPAHTGSAQESLSWKKLAKFAGKTFAVGSAAAGAYYFGLSGLVAQRSVNLGINLVYRLFNWQYIIKPLYKKAEMVQDKAKIVSVATAAPILGQTIIASIARESLGLVGSLSGNIKAIALATMARPICKTIVERLVSKPEKAS